MVQFWILYYLFRNFIITFAKVAYQPIDTISFFADAVAPRAGAWIETFCRLHSFNN